MLDITSEKKIAVLIDAENTSYTVLDFALKEISKHGHLIAKKAYGDWSSVHLKNWKNTLNELAISPVQQFSYTQGKNSSDAALIIDAMDLLYSGKFDAFALISSDSDFTKLATRLKESEIFVFGVGKQSTPIAFRNACDDFIYAEILKERYEEPEKEDKPTVSNSNKKDVRNKLRMDTKLLRSLRDAVAEYSNEDGWASLSLCGGLIKRQNSDFNSKNYGFATLSGLIEATEFFDVQRRKSSGNSAFHIFVKDKRN